MTKQEAQQLVEAYGHNLGVRTTLSPKGFGGIQVGMGSIYFEYDEKAQSLECSALVYKFHDAPKPGIIEGFKAEQAAGTDTGGGTVDYEPENKGLFLSRTYPTMPSLVIFDAEMKRLLAAAKEWGGPVLTRVSQKVFHPEKAK